MSDRETTTLAIAREEAEGLIDEQIEAGGKLLSDATNEVVNQGTYDHWNAKVDRWRRYVVETLRHVFSSDGPADEFNVSYAFVVGGMSLKEELEQDFGHLRRRVNTLSSIRERMRFFAAAPPVEIRDERVKTAKSKVFVVHGHDTAVEEAVTAQLKSAGSYEVIVLQDQPGGSRTLIEKFEDFGEASAFAVVLLTADDVGAAKSETDEDRELKDRARQNVILELGYFMGRLGRDRVAALYEEGVELPSDFVGVEYLSLKANWRYKLLRELRHAGFDYDLDKVRVRD